MMEGFSSREETLYDCVQSLIAAEPQAKTLFMTLDERTQGHMLLHADSICSYAALQNAVQQLRP